MNSQDQFDTFTSQAMSVLNFADEAARDFKHSYIGTEHLLLGMLRESTGIAATVLESLGIQFSTVYEAIESLVGYGDYQVPEQIKFTSNAQQVVQLAKKQAENVHHQATIGTEHLLLGLINVNQGVASGMLERLGVPLERIRQQMIQALRQSGVVYPPVPQKALSLLKEERVLICSRCNAHCPDYFHYCFNCGHQLIMQHSSTAN